MSPKSILILISFLTISYSLSAQYTKKINTNRPGRSQGAFSVGNNVLQGEGGFGFGKEKHTLRDTQTSFFTMDYEARYGLLIEQLEIRLDGTARGDVVKRTVGANEQKTTRFNFVNNTIGAKYLVFDPYKRPKKDSIDLNSWKAQHRFKWKTLIPAVSVYAGMNFNTADNPFTPVDDPSISPKFVLITQNNWTTNNFKNWVLVTNIIIDKITTENPTYGWIITTTHTINDNWAVFGEYQGQKSDFYSDDLFRIGGAYLLNNDIQFDASLTTNFKDTPSIFSLNFGGAYRFDWHKKDEIILEEGESIGIQENPDDLEDNEEDDFEDIDSEFEEEENDTLNARKTPFINDFEDDDHRQEIERELDERRTAERLERERIANEKQAKKDDKKFRKEERRRLKREAKEAKRAEKARLKEEKEKAKMIKEIDKELDQMEKEQGVDQELDEIDKELQKLDNLEKELFNEEEKDTKELEKAKEKELEEEEEDIDAQYEQMKKEEERAQKEEEKRLKKEEKRRKKEEKKRKKEEAKAKKAAEKAKKEEEEKEKELEEDDGEGL
ncbi:hypothetical protein HN014_16055 [Aquimarina sp. TRL1]|uniref:transporter n=1 Tax=Aquimarina sp. (strain TRL1) TaxID=2736252 RepID=UPI00158E1A82|nr:transporter [Aquimarina sp. TRL1]QKX06362.1 hypothetical protein HN014_16055 [Aquimarina sp. TRL1]